MSSTVDLKEKKRVFLESIDTSNGPNTMKMKKKMKWVQISLN